MKGSTIVLSGNPKGMFLEGIINDTSKPGTVMEIVPGIAPVNGRHTWRASSRANGKARLPAILLEDNLQGGKATDAYVAGTRCFLYCPIAGEECNVLVDVPGTGTGSHGGAQIGEFLEYDSAGHLTLESGSPQGTTWQALEYIADPGTLTPQLTWCMYLGG